MVFVAFALAAVAVAQYPQSSSIILKLESAGLTPVNKFSVWSDSSVSRNLEHKAPCCR